MIDTNPHWGARPLAADRWDVAIWAPSAQAVSIRIEGRDTALTKAAEGTWRGEAKGQAGEAYAYVIDGVERPDPASRRQRDDVHGPSILTAPRTPAPWAGRAWETAVIYEMHIGTFTQAGTFAAATAQLPDLAALGLTAVEIMPIAQFAGARGWGYDGVLPYAPHPAYGTPDDFAAFVEAAHRAGLMVILDVVYNHFGPEGAYLGQIAPAFFNVDRVTPWGPAIDFTRRPVRDYVLENALMWVTEFGVDGLRLDAVHELRDTSHHDILSELGTTLRAAVDRPVHLIAEDDRNLPLWRDKGAVTANWNDDYHHAAHCLLTGESESYYASFAEHPLDDLARTLVEGHVEQGQSRPSKDRPRGARSDHLPPTAFINSNQTHDQIGNRAQGDRLLTLADPDSVRVAHALLLTAPAIPMLFMGEEAGVTRPFLFFADFGGDLGQAIRKGRTAEFAGFAAFSGATVPDPLAQATFDASHPFADLPDGADQWRDLTRRALRLRADGLVPLLQSGRVSARTWTLGPRSICAEWVFAAGRMITYANLGTVPDRPWSLPGAQLTLADGAAPAAFATRID